MASAQVRSDRDQLKQIQNMFTQEADRVNKLFNDLYNKEQTLQGGDWIGQGANQFYTEFNDQLYPHLVKLQNALAGAAQTTGQISQLMQDLEDRTSKMFVLRLG